MSLTREVPRAAKPVIDFIRFWVPRPRRLPVPDGGGALDDLRFYGKCPLGLLPFASNFTPTEPEDCGMGERDYHAMDEFTCWWDEQTDPEAATEAVWPTR
jgi:hypothetical protein